MQAHLDTVPVESSEWSVGPFSGEIADGNIWGRGAVDMKNAIAITLASLTRMREKGDVPLRDLLLLVFTANEEQGGNYGAKHLVNEDADLFEGCGVSIGEVGLQSASVRRLAALPNFHGKQGYTGLFSTKHGHFRKWQHDLV